MMFCHRKSSEVAKIFYVKPEGAVGLKIHELTKNEIDIRRVQRWMTCEPVLMRTLARQHRGDRSKKYIHVGFE